MTVESANDRASMLRSSDFGDTATIGVNSFPGILDNEYIDELDVSTLQPVFHCDEAVAVAAGAVNGITVSILVTRTNVSTNYKIRDMEPDGTGMTMLKLEKQ